MVGKTEGVPTKLPEIKFVNITSVKLVDDTFADIRLTAFKLADDKFCDDKSTEDKSWLEISTDGPIIVWLIIL